VPLSGNILPWTRRPPCARRRMTMSQKKTKGSNACTGQPRGPDPDPLTWGVELALKNGLAAIPGRDRGETTATLSILTAEAAFGFLYAHKSKVPVYGFYSNYKEDFDTAVDALECMAPDRETFFQRLQAELEVLFDRLEAELCHCPRHCPRPPLPGS